MPILFNRTTIFQCKHPVALPLSEVRRRRGFRIFSPHSRLIVRVRATSLCGTLFFARASVDGPTPNMDTSKAGAWCKTPAAQGAAGDSPPACGDATQSTARPFARVSPRAGRPAVMLVNTPAIFQYRAFRRAPPHLFPSLRCWSTTMRNSEIAARPTVFSLSPRGRGGDGSERRRGLLFNARGDFPISAHGPAPSFCRAAAHCVVGQQPRDFPKSQPGWLGLSFVVLSRNCASAGAPAQPRRRLRQRSS